MATILNDGAVRPADDLDRLLGHLLDLQHDLAEVVVWLAETWPEDLPAPKLTHQVTDEPRYGHRLWVCFRKTDQLYRAAATLGVPIEVGQHSPDGDRYARAVRSFGRVEVEAFARAEIIEAVGP